MVRGFGAEVLEGDVHVSEERPLVFVPDKFCSQKKEQRRTPRVTGVMWWRWVDGYRTLEPAGSCTDFAP